MPPLEIFPKFEEWFVVVNVDGLLKEFTSKSDALKKFKNYSNALLIDVLNNSISRTSGNNETDEKCKIVAVKLGYFIDSHQEDGGLLDLVPFFFKHIEMKEDAFLLIMIITFGLLSHYVGGYSEILSGI